MIIKGERVTSSRSAAPLLRHLLHGEENDRVLLLQGTQEDARAAFADARTAERKFALRHFIISPETETRRAEAMMVFGLLAKDFAFDPTTAIIFEHEKPRAVATAFGTHWHCLVPEIDAGSGRVMDSRFSYLRHEKVARIAEHRLGHPFLRSNHEQAVLAALEGDGLLDVAAALRAFISSDPGKTHHEAFSMDVQQMAKRQGVNVPAARAAVRAAWETAVSWPAFTHALSVDGYRISTGNRDGTLIVESQDGIFVGALHRLAHVRKIDVQRRKELSDERSAQAKQCAGDAGVDARRHPTDSVGIGDPGKQRVVRDSEQRPSHPTPDRYPYGNPGLSNESGGPASTPRCGSTLHSGGFSAALRLSLIRSPKATQALLERARTIAKSPVERVRIRLANYEERLKKELQCLLSPAIESSGLDAQRHKLTAAKASYEKAKEKLSKAREEREVCLLNRPTGFMMSLRPETRKWNQRLKAADDEIETLKEQCASAWEKQRDMQGILVELEKEARLKSRQLLETPAHQDKLAARRRQIARVAVARRLLEKIPAVALGGLPFLLVAAVAAETIDSWSGHRFDTDDSFTPI